MLRLLAFLILNLLSLLAHGGLAATLTANDVRHDLAGHEISYLRDPRGEWRIDDVASPAFASNFQEVLSNPSFGYTRDVIWLRVTLQRDSTAPELWALEVTNPFINDLQFYTPRNPGFVVAQAGDRFPFSQREIAFHHPVFNVVLPDTKGHTFYLRMASDSSLSVQLPLWQPSALRIAGQQEILLFGGMLGMAIMSFLIALVHWASSRDPLLLRFCGMTLTIFVFVPAQNGFLSQFVFMNYPLIGDLMVPWTLGLMVATVHVVIGTALEIPTKFPRSARVLRAMFVLCLMMPLTREIDLYWLVGGPMLQILFISSLILTGGISVLRWKARVEGAAYFVSAHAVLIGSLIAGRLTLLGILPVNTFTQASWIPGAFTFLLLVHAGIVMDALVATRERNSAVKEALLAKEVATSEHHLRREQTVFFSFVAHELRSPLGIITAGLKNLQREFAQFGPDTQSRLSRMGRAAERLGSLIESHLQLQRLTNADFLPHFIAVAPCQPAEDALAEVRAAYPERTFELVCTASLPTSVEVDAELIVLALGNLLSNAAKYSPNEDPVLLEVAADHMLHYRVRDHGSGLSAEEQSRLFKVFQRSASAKGKIGFGIGLATAKRVAEVHDGSLAYADGQGGGAQFTLSVPLSHSRETPA